MGGRNAFTLLEIIIMVAVIALMTAIIIPGFLRTRIGANEAAAQAALKSLSMSCERYREEQRVPSYDPADNCAGMTAADPGGISAELFAVNDREGYVFSYVSGAPVNNVVQTYDCAARPVRENMTGVRWFVIDESGVLREDADKDAVADAEDPIIQ
ncbi:MAG: type II secretion system protein [Candidatus Omnitrophica bacterium]|nr:type II secretion system protein [Candidatus Omnitrophota bacterium]